MQVQRVSLRRQTKATRNDRDQIVLEHLPLVRAIAIRVHENLPVHVELDDLNHAGVLGLFDAVDKFDPAKNVEFRMLSTASRAPFWIVCGNWTGLRATCANGRTTSTPSRVIWLPSWGGLPPIQK